MFALDRRSFAWESPFAAAAVAAVQPAVAATEYNKHLAGFDFDTTAEEIMVKEFRFAEPETTRNERLSIMREFSVTQLPILDDMGKVVDLELSEPRPKFPVRHNNIFIMAGGKGTRMGDLTANCPKPMLSVFGKPILMIWFCIWLPYWDSIDQPALRDSSYWSDNPSQTLIFNGHPQLILDIDQPALIQFLY